ncbi:MAG: hypothetical protein J7L75_02040 [Thermoproteales archaeon]|nr:hypothetical protein [Thermoproteales archaeon]
MRRARRLQGIVVEVAETPELREDEEGVRWRKCIFTIELRSFAGRPGGDLPAWLKGARVRVVRWCCLDWHYRTGVRATLTREETEAVLRGELDLTRWGA